MRTILRASVLVLALCCPAFAGDIPCPIVAPTPQSAAVMEDTPADGEIQAPQTPDTSTQDGAAAVTFFEIMLNLLALL